MSRRMTKPTKRHVRPVKTQISIGIRPVWSESPLSAWIKLGSTATHWEHSEDTDQTGRIPRLIWVFAGRTVILLVLSWSGSNKYSGSSHIIKPSLWFTFVRCNFRTSLISVFRTSHILFRSVYISFNTCRCTRPAGSAYLVLNHHRKLSLPSLCFTQVSAVTLLRHRQKCFINSVSLLFMFTFNKCMSTADTAQF